MLTVNCEDLISKPGGTPVKRKDAMVYLGSVLTSDGRAESELGRRVGAAADFDALKKVWGHSTITRQHKFRVFNACILSKFMYSLHISWYDVVARRRLDGCQARCVRYILGIQPSFLSRMSNAEVFARAGVLRASLLQRQLGLFGRLAMSDGACALRAAVLHPASLELKQASWDRRVGRPRQYWPTMVRGHVVAAVGGEEELVSLLSARAASTMQTWNSAATKSQRGFPRQFVMRCSCL